MSNTPQTPAPPDAPKVRTMARKWPYVLAFANWGGAVGALVILPYQTMFLTNRLGLPTHIVSIILFGGTCSSWICSMVTGAAVQEFQSKMGRYRHWLLVAPPMVLISYSWIFSGIKLHPVVQAVSIMLAYGTAGFFYQVLTVVTQSCVSLVAGTDPNNRLEITSTQAVGGRIITFITGLITGPFIRWGNANGINPFLYLTFIYNGFALIPYWFLLFQLKGVDVYDPNFKKSATGEKVKGDNLLKQYAELFTKNGPWRALWLSAIVSGFGMNVVNPLNAYYFQYSLAAQGGMALQAVQSSVSTPVGMISATIARPFARKIGKKNSSLVSRYYGFISGILTAFLTDGNFLAKLIIFQSSTVMNALNMAWGMNYYQDAAEYHEHATGNERKSFILGSSNIPSRLAAAIGTPMAPYILQWSGFDSATRTFPSTKNLVIFIGLFPAVCNLISGIMFHIGYKLTDEEAATIAAANIAKRQAAAEAKAAAAT